ncbi:uncharacterized protein LOC105354609 [Oryzias latipes]|uniref:uncharacterized protein LOC105354609 n=1 Tax=Oryzias latipes TaxID=8090 RepID=UPI000CE26F85|nr:uncharacterized protein LOC105354609 [Oryzias latipes]
MNSLRAEDSAVYYCARDGGHNAFDYWGKGTTVTVTSDTPTQAPNVFPLMPCGPQSRDTVTLGCLAVDFTPSSLTFSWTQGSNNLENITQYPSILKNDKYLGISQVEVSRQDWDAKKTFQCAANHLGERTTSLPFTKQDVLFRSPNLTTSFSLDEEKQQASFYCFAKDFSPRTHEIIWQKVGSEKASILDETSVFSEGRNDTNGAKLYSAASLLTVNPTELTSGATFTCVFKGKGVNNTDVLEKANATYKEESSGGSAGCTQAAVDLKIIGPTYRDILVKQSGKITCQIHVNNGELEKMLWENENEVEMAGTVKNEGLKKKEELVLDITYDEWHQGVERYCVVQHKDIIFPFKIQYKRQKSEHVQRPSVFMLPPVEHAKNKEVTLTCSVKDFFPEEVFIAWLVDDDVVDSKYKTSTTSPVEKQGSYLVYSQLTLTDDQWKQSGVVYSCAVYHESITNSTRSIVRSIGFSTDDKNNLVNLNLNISEKCKAYCVFANLFNTKLCKSTTMPSVLKFRRTNAKTCHLFSITELRVVSPNISLFPVWDGEFGVSQVRLICTLNGYFPKNLSVEWQQNKQQLTQIQPTERHLQSVEGGEKTYSLTSEIEPNMEEWTRGSNFTCKFIHKENKDEKTTSICHIFGFNPPSIHVEIPSFKTVMMTNSDVKARCFIHNVDAKLVWLMDEEQPSTDRVNEFSNKTTLISELTVPSSSWKNLKLLKCKVQHHCFSAEKTVEISGSAVSAPHVDIRRSLSDLQTENNDVKLHCDLSQLSSQHLYVTLQSKGADISDKQYVDLPEAPASHTVSVSFSVPHIYWKSDQSFTCKVHQGFSSQSFESKAISVFVDPSVEVLQVSSKESGQHKLLCSASGFNPQISWFSDSVSKSASSTDISMDTNGRVTVISRLDVLQTEWKTGKTFTCEVFDRFLNKRDRKDISLCSDLNPPTVRIVEPSAAELSVSDILTLTCLVSGYFPSNISVHWKENGQKLSSSRYINSPSFKDPDSSSYSMSCRLNVSQTNDKKSTYTCVVRHESSNSPFESSIKDVFASVTHSEPSAVLLQGSNELVCLVFGFSPASINITWIADGSTELWNYNNSHPHRGPDGKFSIQSFLRLSPVDSLPGVTITCRVTHGNTTLSVNVSKTDTLEHCHFFDDILHADVSQDTVMQAWGMAIFFLLLFFISIIFSAVTTALKIK